MRFSRTVLILALISSSSCSKSEPPAPTAPTASPAPTAPAPRQSTYGTVTAGPSVSPADVVTRIDELAGKVVRVEGTATGVCEKRGCWMAVTGTDGQEIRVKVKDGEVVFPVSARGKKVIAEGVAVKIPADPAADSATCGGGEHHAAAEEPHESCARPAGASARIDGTGAIVFEG